MLEPLSLSHVCVFVSQKKKKKSQAFYVKHVVGRCNIYDPKKYNQKKRKRQTVMSTNLFIPLAEPSQTVHSFSLFLYVHHLKFDHLYYNNNNNNKTLL